ncbi:glycosyltransferase [Candidatus Margulisiibacteriota bacterium]
MKLLWLCHFIPYPLDFGGAIRAFQLIKAAAKANEVHLACLCWQRTPPEVPKALKEICTSVNIFRKDFSGKKKPQLLALLNGQSSLKLMNRSKELDSWLHEHAGEFDAVVMDHTQMAWANVPKNVPRIIALHNIESELLKRTVKNDQNFIRRTYRRLDAEKLERAELAALKLAKTIIITSEREKELLQGLGLKMPIEVINNGADTKKFAAAASNTKLAWPKKDIIFIGAGHYYPNEEAILWFYNNVWGKLHEIYPDLNWHIIGGKPGKNVLCLVDKNVKVLTNVPNILPHFQSARLLSVPLLSGSGTRIKILEGAAAGVPIVTTSLGVEGLPFKNKEHCLIADDPASFQAACLDVLEDQNSAGEMALRARELVAKNYDWDIIGNELLRFFEHCIK